MEDMNWEKLIIIGNVDQNISTYLINYHNDVFCIITL